MRFSLYDMEGVCVVVAAPTGVVYSNQTGGTACLQPELEGALLPVNWDGPVGGPNTLELRLAEVFVQAGHFDDDMADRIDEIMSRSQETEGIRVDRRRYRDCHEAWVHVTVTQTAAGGIQGISAPMCGVLTWQNSD